MRFLYRRGKGVRRRVVHLTPFDPGTGFPTMRPLCGRDYGIVHDTTSNVPLGLRRCIRCFRGDR